MKTKTAPAERVRRAEILDTAARLFGSWGTRTSLQEIADACGIQAGSLYHHFESREAIIVELIVRYQTELDRIAARAVERSSSADAGAVRDQIVALAEAIAACAVRHRAAVLQTLYDPPASAGEALAGLAPRTLTAIDAAMLELLRKGEASGEIRGGLDLASLADRLCRSMLNLSIGTFHHSPGARRVPAVRCRMIFQGLAVTPPPDEALDRSIAFEAANAVIAGWERDDDSPASLLRVAARSEFGRRGYEASTMRGIAAAAGMSLGKVYRLARSKDELLTSILASYLEAVTAGWTAVLASRSTPLEKLDALLWVNINVLHRFGAEFRMQAWWRQSPPGPTSLDRGVTRQLPQIRGLLTEGERQAAFRVLDSSAIVRAHCLFELLWTPENLVRRLGPRAALALMRESLLRGAAIKESGGHPA